MSFSQITTDPPYYGGTAEPITVTAPNGRPTEEEIDSSESESSSSSSAPKRSNLSWLSPLIGIGSDIINYLLNKRDYKEQFDMNNHEWERRFDLTNRYNEQWADRLRAQGINPLSAVGQGVSGNSASMAGGPQMMSGPLSSMSNFLESLKTGAEIENTESDTAMKDFDVLLKKQLLDFNAKLNPTLIAEANQRYSNSVQEYNNLVAKENYDKKAAAELEQRILTEKAQAVSLYARAALDNANLPLVSKQVEKLAQDIVTGQYIQEYEKWHAKHEEQLSILAKHKANITETEFEQLYESGLFGTIKKYEMRNLYSAYIQGITNIQHMWNTKPTSIPLDTDERGLPKLARLANSEHIMLYLFLGMIGL